MNDHDEVPARRGSPILTEEKKGKIVAGLRRDAIELRASDNDWGVLEQILTFYEDKAAFWAGFPNKGQVSMLDSVGAKAGRLGSAINKALEEGLGIILEDQLQGHDLDKLRSALACLADMDAKSPRTDVEEKRRWDKWLERSAAEMQGQMDQWWRDIAGCEPVVEESKVTPYTYFLNQLFPELSGPQLGGSRTAVEKRRRARAEFEEQWISVGNWLRGFFLR